MKKIAMLLLALFVFSFVAPGFAQGQTKQDKKPTSQVVEKAQVELPTQTISVQAGTQRVFSYFVSPSFSESNYSPEGNDIINFNTFIRKQISPEAPILQESQGSLIADMYDSEDEWPFNEPKPKPKPTRPPLV